ncbi:MotA/TolQ/ExbB proton channel family protein [Oxalobacter paraformigenes]|uniref:MotA/TolQ/ExbB proton channel domain-containing protein n=1 Tax=Oxalobacter paraformigenes TaxID=556268 RepID=C3X6L2_9BURK|nr:MotA/TolQ/ExbB proton channel family protein [Oxalobacter paraformigenes]EEO28848.1 hypothetical protein OFAG_02001 [Oxalobacter paraformigenes]
MFYIIQAAGWPIWLLLIASVIALALIIERLWYLRRSRILPAGLLEQTIRDYREGRIDNKTIAWLEGNSPLGAVLATGLQHSDVSRDNMREAMEETGRSVALQMERFLTTIGTIATLAPLMGLFGTVVGMIEIFGSQSATGTNPAQLAHGISVALYNTGFGLLIAMPTLIFYRHFRALVTSFLIEMERQSARLVDAICNSRRS